tara:strand:- start:515 stop:1279 length:765 start_codon:yes stop_codon:yes gene_type:complete
MIPEIKIPNIEIAIAKIPDYYLDIELNIPKTTPVTLSIGSPIIQLPGCIEYNPANKKSNKLTEEDQKGNVILCDGTVPSYNPMNYEPEQLILTKPAEVPQIPLDTDEVFEPPEPELPNTNTPEIICPPIEAPIVGSKVEGNKKISGYEIQNGRCVTLYEEIPIVNQVLDALPTAGAVTTTASIALVATSSAVLAKPLADLVLKAIKPLIKTSMKKIQKLLGKNPRKLAQAEILANQYREKKGLPALKELKKAKK